MELIQCPVCQRSVASAEINAHLDSCLVAQEQHDRQSRGVPVFSPCPVCAREFPTEVLPRHVNDAHPDPSLAVPAAQPSMQPILQPSMQPTMQPMMQPNVPPAVHPMMQPSMAAGAPPSPVLFPWLQPTQQNYSEFMRSYRHAQHIRQSPSPTSTTRHPHPVKHSSANPNPAYSRQISQFTEFRSEKKNKKKVRCGYLFFALATSPTLAKQWVELWQDCILIFDESPDAFGVVQMRLSLSEVVVTEPPKIVGTLCLFVLGVGDGRFIFASSAWSETEGWFDALKGCFGEGVRSPTPSKYHTMPANHSTASNATVGAKREKKKVNNGSSRKGSTASTASSPPSSPSSPTLSSSSSSNNLKEKDTPTHGKDSTKDGSKDGSKESKDLPGFSKSSSSSTFMTLFRTLSPSVPNDIERTNWKTEVTRHLDNEKNCKECLLKWCLQKKGPLGGAMSEMVGNAQLKLRFIYSLEEETASTPKNTPSSPPSSPPSSSPTSPLNSNHANKGDWVHSPKVSLEFSQLSSELAHFLITFTNTMESLLPVLSSPPRLVWARCAAENALFPPLYSEIMGLYRLKNLSKDVAIREKCQSLMNVTPRHLISSSKFTLLDRVSLSDPSPPYAPAILLLQSLSTLLSPSSKLLCLVSVSQCICDCVVDYWKGEIDPSELSLSCDDLLPILMYVVIRSGVQYPRSEVEFMKGYMTEEMEVGEWGFALATFEASMEAILCLDAGEMVESAKEQVEKIMKRQEELERLQKSKNNTMNHSSTSVDNNNNINNSNSSEFNGKSPKSFNKKMAEHVGGSELPPLPIFPAPPSSDIPVVQNTMDSTSSTTPVRDLLSFDDD